MSGGRYDYLFTKDPEQLFEYIETVERMADRLAGLGYAQDAARETQELLLLLRQAIVRIEVRKQRLAGVWHAVEWWDSMDSGEGDVKEALAEYRKELEGA